jgi:hypothetical protein
VTADQLLPWSARVFGAAFVVHAVDHLIRGFDASPTFVMAVGFVQGALVLVAVGMVLLGAPHATVAAVVVGLLSIFAVTYGHLLPDTSQQYADSFATAPHTNVSWFSWLSASAEAAAATLFVLAGARALLSRRQAAY